MNPDLPFESFTGQARRVVWLAFHEAERLGHDYLASEHLLAGLLRDGSPAITGALREQSIEPTAVLDELDALFAEAGPAPADLGIHPTPRIVAALRRAIDLAGRDGLPRAGSAHLLLAMLADPENAMRGFLEQVGLDLARVERSLHAAPPEPDRDTLLQAPGKSPSGVDPSAGELSRLLTDPTPRDIPTRYELSAAVRNSMAKLGQLLLGVGPGGHDPDDLNIALQEPRSFQMERLGPQGIAVLIGFLVIVVGLVLMWINVPR